MTRTSYQLMKNDEPIAIGSMSHCLDVFYWEIYHSYNHLAYNIVPFRQDEEVYRKAQAFDEVLELHSQHIDKSSIYGNDLPLSVNKYEYYDDGLFAYEMYTLIRNYLEDE